MSCSLNSLKRVIYGGLYRGVSGLIKGDTRSLDYSSNASSYLAKAKWEAFLEGVAILLKSCKPLLYGLSHQSCLVVDAGLGIRATENHPEC